MSDTLRTGFAGTPAFAATIAQAMLDAGIRPAVVYTQPDRRAGRGRKTVPSPVKQLALDNDLPVEQPLSLRDDDALATLAGHRLDVLVVAAYGLILPRAALDVPRHGCINVHASLLPRWRGASPIQAAIAHRDALTGVTIMQMDEGLDTGPIISTVDCPTLATDTAASLEARLATLGGSAIVEALRRLGDGPLDSVAQPGTGACYAGRIAKNDGWLDPAMAAIELEARVRALQPWPVAFVIVDGERLRVFEAEARPTSAGATPGTVVEASDAGIDIACSDGVLRLLRVQRAGGKPVAAAEYLKGRPIAPGTTTEPLE